MDWHYNRFDNYLAESMRSVEKFSIPSPSLIFKALISPTGFYEQDSSTIRLINIYTNSILKTILFEMEIIQMV